MKNHAGLTSENITRIDYFSFLLAIRRLLNNDVSFSFTCQKCGTKFKDSFDLEERFNDEIQNFRRKQLIFEKNDNNGNNWKFELSSYTMKDYLYFKFYLEEIKNIENEDYQNDTLLNPLLYITKIYKNNEEIEDWNEQNFLNKLNFFKKIPGEIIIGIQKNKNISANNFLLSFIQSNFDEEKINDFVSNIKVMCPSCMEEYSNVYSFNDLFYVLGFAEDNQEIYKNILESESYLIYYHWLSLNEINNMSYLDFTIYSERIFALYEAEQKQKEEEMKNQENQINSIEFVTDDY